MNNCNCKKINSEINKFNFNEISNQINNCQKCCYQKEELKNKLNLNTYLKTRLKYVELFWKNHKKGNK